MSGNIKNQAYEGMYLEEGKTYKVSAFIKSNSNATVKVFVIGGGENVAEGTLVKGATSEWKKYETTITATKTARKAEFVLAATANIDIDMISCMPEDAPCGLFRKDLAEKLKDLHPGFLRFPGGCIVEGYNIANRYEWKDTVGPVEQRKQNWSRWSCHTNNGLDGGFKHYNQTYGLGFYEYFKLCEYLECDPVPVVNVGMACEYQSNETVPVFNGDGKTYTAEFYSYIQDALDLIEFANGDENTTWGKVRADMGHREPFNLDKIGIGNEQWAKSGNQWYERYEAFEKEIHKVYPDMKLISTSGPSASGADFDNAWKWIREKDAADDSFTYAVDEHYYMSPEWFLNNDGRYDNYDRRTKVFAGEYAAHTTLASDLDKKNNLESAIAEAAFLTGVERNADVVKMASYAPLFARLNYTQWAPDMIWFNDAESYVSPTYYVQQMYMTNMGDYTLQSAVGGSYGKVYKTASYDEETGDIIVKIANPTTTQKTSGISVSDTFTVKSGATVTTLTGGGASAVNSISNPDNIKPVTSEINNASNNMTVTLPALSFTTVRLHTDKSELKITGLEVKNGKVNYYLSPGSLSDDKDVYAALYDDKGRLCSLTKNEVNGEAEVGASNSYTLKVMVWYKNTMTPALDTPLTATVSAVEKISETTYKFTDDSIVKTGGTAANGAVYELGITSAPQYFYIDTVDFDNIGSIEIHSGYEKNSAVTSIYAYDNGGNAVDAATLTGFMTNNAPLGESVASIADSKTAQWGYRTAIIDSEGVTMVDSPSYTKLDTSKKLTVPDGTGEKALIVGISGDIGSKGYFDYIKINYKNPVDAPMPQIESIKGNGIKDSTVEIDSTKKSIVIPVVPGTDLDKLSATVDIKGASAELTSGSWKDGELTLTYGDKREVYTVKAEDRGNPVLNGYYADPNICVFGDTFYIYPTTDGGSGWNSTSFKAFSSKDLVNWKDEGEILSLKDVPWSSGVYAWAPTAAYKDGRYYYYYSGTQSIGVAVADSPTGPFVDKGEPLVNKNTAGLAGQMIDPAVFVDDDGQGYIYWGNGKMYGAKLSDDMMSIEGEIKEMTPTHFREGSFVIKRDGKYYFMWSDNDTGEPTYEVHYGTSTMPLGTITGDTKILSYENTDDTRIRGTGHNSVINIPGTDDWYICYHRFNLPRYGTVTAKNSEAGNHREVCIDKLEFNADGTIKPVTATLKGITEPVTVSRPQEDKYVRITGDKTVYLGKTYNYTAAVSDNSAVTWSVSDETVATVSDKGVLTPVKEGTVTLTATSATAGTKSMTITVLDGDRLAVENAEESLSVDSEIYGNIDMPASVGDATVVWTSTDENAIKPDGKVTRPAADTPVKLTATITSGSVSKTKEFNVTVKAAPTGKTESDMAAYLFVHFVGTESNSDQEQIYFSLSKDGTTWQTLNDGAPVLTSNLGEKGVRDPHIIRSPEGDKFFLVATDLSIYNRRDDSNRWGTCQTSGSKSIVIWESTDLVNWSEARLVKVAPDNAGCTWAPESIYDDASGRYMVFWASKTSTDNYATQRVYRSYTRDFKNFTEPEVYIDGGNISNIDTTFIKDNGTYYRFTKNESKSSVIMEKSASLDGNFEAVGTYTINGSAGNGVTGYEGPTAYKINGENKWCLLLDYYSKSQGYKPFMTNDISVGAFTSAADFNFDTKYRHGTVMPITQEEYDALKTKYTKVEEEETGEVVFDMSFDSESVTPESGTATANGTITFADGFKGKAAVLDGSDFIELTGDKNGNNPLTGLESFTVSFAAKADAQSWWFYTAPNTTAQTYKSEKYVGVLDKVTSIEAERYNSNNMERPSQATTTASSGWRYITVVHRKDSVTIYINGVQASKVKTAVSLPTMLGTTPIAYIGKANWGSGEYSKGMIDEFKIYNYALSDTEIADAYASLTE